jgi:hypothetical protein
MAESKYGHLICTDLKRDIQLPAYRQGGQPIGAGEPDGVRPHMEHVIWLDSEVVPGAFYTECAWVWPWGNPSDEGVAPHTHPFDEVIAYFGTDLDDPYDLGGEVELWLEDEQFFLTKSFMAFVPAGLKHCPLKHSKIVRPIFHFTMGAGKEYR